MIKVGSIVRYKKEWCSEGEEKYIHVVRENLLNPVKDTMTRWLIETINTSLTWNPTETVDDYMIEEIEGYEVEV